MAGASSARRAAPKSRHTPGQLVIDGMSALEPRKEKRDQPEFFEQREVFTFLRERDRVRRWPVLRWVHHIPNGLYLIGAVKKKAVDSGLTAGVWDIFVPCARRRYHGLYVEMKCGDNGLTEEQTAFGEHAKHEGYARAIAYNWVDGVSLILDYLMIDDVEIDEALDINRRASVRYATPPRMQRRRHAA